MNLRIVALFFFCMLAMQGTLASGFIDPQTGEYFPGTGDGGAINPRTGEYFPGTGGGGSINPRTGAYYPGVGQDDSSFSYGDGEDDARRNPPRGAYPDISH